MATITSGRDLDKMERQPSVESNRRRSLRIALVTENFLPKVDGVTRTLARLLEHLTDEGHQALICGPESGMTSYAGHEVIGTAGIPLLGVYSSELKLNFIRPKFIRRLIEFKPDVIQFVDPIWLCAQCIPAIQYFLPHVPLLTSYHTNLACYATLFGFSWLTSTIWDIQRNLHGRCRLTFCPSPSTARMLEGQGFKNVRLWPRGSDTTLFNPRARDSNLRQAWGVTLPINPVPAGPLDSLSPPPYSPTSSYIVGEKVTLLYVGRISWEKNLRLLVEAFRGLEKADGDRPACQLVFVGEGPARAELETLCAGYGLGAIFMGYRKGEQLAAAYASADIFAFPSWTETFGQVVLEALASGTPVVGLRAEGVCDLVKSGETGLLLDLDDLLPSGSKEKFSSPITFKPLPENPHLLLDTAAATFHVAVSMYRSLLVELATNHALREQMGQAAAIDAATRSWHGAMEMIVDGYREIALPQQSNLTLSRTSTLEVDVVSHSPNDEELLASSTTAIRSHRSGVGRVLRLGAVLRRSGGRLRDGSMTIPRTFLWRGRADLVEGDDQLLLKRSTHGWTSGWVFILIALSYILYLGLEYLSASPASQRTLALLNLR